MFVRVLQNIHASNPHHVKLKKHLLDCACLYLCHSVKIFVVHGNNDTVNGAQKHLIKRTDFCKIFKLNVNYKY